MNNKDIVINPCNRCKGDKWIYEKLKDKAILKIDDINNNYMSFTIITKDYVFLLVENPTIHALFCFYNNSKKFMEILKVNTIVDKGIYEVREFTYENYEITPIKTDYINPILSKEIEEKITNDIEFFFNNKQFYEYNKIPYKRGILLYGPPGNGKTTIIKQVVSKYKYHIFILNDIVLKNSLIKFLNEISGKQQKIIIIEDIDRHPEYMISSLLNTLDGISKNENMLVIATCNNIANIDTALINRPSRFDRIYYLGDPNEDQRERLLKYYFPKIKLEELNECIELSKGFSCAYFKELFLTSKINNLTPVEALKYFKEQLKLISERYTKDAFRK